MSDAMLLVTGHLIQPVPIALLAITTVLMLLGQDSSLAGASFSGRILDARAPMQPLRAVRVRYPQPMLNP